jgi:hypothetical protein
VSTAIARRDAAVIPSAPMRATSAAGLTVAMLWGAGTAAAERVAPDPAPAAVDDAPADASGDGEPRLFTTEPVARPAATRRTHKGQFGLAVSLMTGGRFIKTYDGEYCGDRDANGATTGNSTVCMGRIPVAFDLSFSYGVTSSIELLLDLRLGIERDFGGTVSDSDGPRLRHYAPGVKFYFADSGILKFFSTAQVAFDDTGYTSPTGEALGMDVSVRNANGIQLDFHDAYGAFAFFAEDVAFRRWMTAGIEFGAGFQGRYP